MRKNKLNIYKLFTVVFFIGLICIYALPNFYNKVPSIVIIPKEQTYINIDKTKSVIESEIDGKISTKNNELSISFVNIENQMNSYDKIKSLLNENDFYINLTMLPSHPKWINYFKANSVSLGLDLMGGVHFLMEVDIDDIKLRTLNSYEKNIKNTHSDFIFKIVQDEIVIKPFSKEIENKIIEKYPNVFKTTTENNKLKISFQETYLKNTIDSAIKQNILILKNRINELGVSEPTIQREGFSRIIVQLPGIQDTQKAKDLIGTTASLSFKKLLEQKETDNNSEKIYDISGSQSYIFNKESIIDGSSIIDASSGIDVQSGSPLVSVTLNNEGGEKMLKYTSNNVGTGMGSILEETFYKTVTDENGLTTKEKTLSKKAINVATIQGSFSTRFQVTGLTNKEEAHNLAILLRSGSLIAPIEIIEEKTIGPSMGAENIENGKKSIMIGFLMVLVLMIVRYKTLGLIANFCVIINMFMLLVILSLLGATLTLPGIAGILLTIGMAVDGNVIIFERIKEEFEKTKDYEKSIKNGYEKAVKSIIDANITTFFAAFVLFIFGTGAVKGFAVTLSIGIITSFITSVYLSEYIVKNFYKTKNKKESKENV